MATIGTAVVSTVGLLVTMLLVGLAAASIKTADGTPVGVAVSVDGIAVAAAAAEVAGAAVMRAMEAAGAAVLALNAATAAGLMPLRPGAALVEIPPAADRCAAGCSPCRLTAGRKAEEPPLGARRPVEERVALTARMPTADTLEPTGDVTCRA